jgi:hypothetical protein
MDSVIDLTRAYAAHMDGWRAEPDTTSEYRHVERAFLIHDGERVRVRVESAWQGNRLIVTPVYPYEHGVSGPRSDGITVSRDRDSAAAAKDILRRAVPAAIEGARQWEANIAAHKARLTEMARLRADLAEEFPTLTPWPGADVLNFGWRPDPNDEDYRQHGTVKLHGGSLGATVELHGLTVEQVKRMLRAIEQED